MPSVDDLFQKLIDANNSLNNQINATLTSGFNKLVTLGVYTNQALSQNAKQNDTMICYLNHIAQNTCELLNQSVIQTALQTDMQKGVAALADMYATVHPEAALERERLQALKAQIEKCCPPPRREPPCHFSPCPAPPPLGEPPKVAGEPTRPPG